MRTFDPVEATRLAHRVLMVSFNGTRPPGWLDAGLAGGIGAVCLFGSNLTGDDDQVRRLTARLHAASPAGCLVTLDEEGGDVTRLDARHGGRTAGHAVLGAVDDPELTREVATGLGARLHGLGVDLDLGPVADVNCEPDNPVIGVRSFGAGPQLVARHVTAFVEGLQTAGVGACVKHFPGHGATVEDSHLAAPRLTAGLDVLRVRELVPFAAAVRAGTAAVMTSHIVITALDADAPATTSRPVLDLLRDELGFGGLLITDALNMTGVTQPHGGPAAAALAALAAGADLLCLGPERRPGEQAGLVREVVEEVLAAVEEGRLPLARLEEAAARVENLVMRTASAPSPAPPVPAPGLDPNHRAASRALRLAGAPAPDLTGAVVVEFGVAPMIAAGPVPWSLAEPLAAVLPAAPGVLRRPARPSAGDEDVTGHLRAAAGRPLIAVVRDAHRHPWVGTRLTALAAARPDLVTVETGWPLVDATGEPTGLPGGTRLWTYGGSALSLRAAAELLTGTTPP